MKRLFFLLAMVSLISGCMPFGPAIVVDAGIAAKKYPECRNSNSIGEQKECIDQIVALEGKKR